MTNQPPAIDLSAIKTKQQATWASGDYAVIGTTLQLVGERLVEAIDLRAGERVLDVAAGNGNASLAAARHFARVVSTDYVGHLLERGQARAAAEHLPIEFQVADAEALPFDGEQFDAVLSTFGVMFTPDQERAAAELVRVCKRGGRIGLTNWTPDGFIGRVFRVIGRHLPPAAGLRSPALWGTEARLAELFSDHAVRIERKHFQFRYLSAAHFLDTFRTYYGPTLQALAALGPAAPALAADLLGLLEDARRPDVPDALVVPSEYVEVVVTRAR